MVELIWRRRAPDDKTLIVENRFTSLNTESQEPTPCGSGGYVLAAG
jgi:hypothetical protein